jgi:hypothetical protein
MIHNLYRQRVLVGTSLDLEMAPIYAFGQCHCYSLEFSHHIRLYNIGSIVEAIVDSGKGKTECPSYSAGYWSLCMFITYRNCSDFLLVAE